MDLSLQRRQQVQLNRKQRQLRRLLRQIMRSRRANDSDVYEELVARSIAQMFTRSLTMQALTNRMTVTTTTTPEPPQDNDTTDVTCHDIRGRDRACCNTALACFDDVANVIDDLQHSPNDYSLLTACRKVSEELKRDRVCVKQGLSSCDGTGKAVLQRRFDLRIDNLYDQFYKHCRGRTVAPTTTTTTNSTTPIPVVTNQSTQRPVYTTRAGSTLSPAGPGTYTSSPTENTQQTGSNAGIDSGAIIVGAVTGGAILLVMIIIAIVLWCRNRRKRYDSDGSGGSNGVFFQKRPNARAHGHNNNNKPAATRQDSTVYAEIDERFVNARFKPPLPSDMTNEGYLHPIGDDSDLDHYNQPNNVSGGVPMATTRGQLSYGPILAANSNSNSSTDNSLFYYSTTLNPPTDHPQSGRERELPRIPQSRIEDDVSNSLFRAKPGERQDNFYVECHADSNEDLDEYEEPVSAQNSVKYSRVETDPSPPYEPAPAVPKEQKTPENKHKMAVKVLPSNPFSSATETSSTKSTSDPNTPIAKPRRKKESNTIAPDEDKPKSMDLSKYNLSNRDSSVSETSVKSSHHYFVLEPEGKEHDELGYENSVSSSKLV